MLDHAKNQENHTRNPGRTDKKIDRQCENFKVKSKRVCTNRSIKINMLIEERKRYQIDPVLLNEASNKRSTINAGRMEKNLKKISREVKMMTEDSKEWNVAPKYYLPGRLMSAFFWKVQIIKTG